MPECALAQANDGTAALTGTVLDQSGTPIPGAAVAVRPEGTDATSRTTTQADGRYSLPGLPAGVYTIEVSSPNFATSRREGVKLAAGATENIQLALALAALPQTVTVEATVSLAAEMAPSQSSLEARSAE